MIIWVYCRARKSMPGAIIFPLCLHFYWLCHAWQKLSGSQWLKGVILYSSQGEEKGISVKPNLLLKFWEINYRELSRVFQSANKARHGKTYDHREVYCLDRCISSYFSALEPCWFTALLWFPFLWRHYVLLVLLPSPSSSYSCEAWSNCSTVKLLRSLFHPPVEHLVGLSCIVARTHTPGPSVKTSPTNTQRWHLPAQYFHFLQLMLNMARMQLETERERDRQGRGGGQSHGRWCRDTQGLWEWEVWQRDGLVGVKGWIVLSCFMHLRG